MAENREGKKFIQEQKSKEIKLNIESFLNEKIPELRNIDGGFTYVKPTNKIETEFSNLVFDKILLIYNENDKNPDQKTQQLNQENIQKQWFRISNKVKFKTLKSTACNFWDLREEDYQITDEIEAIMNEELEIDYFLRNYSVQVNTFRLVHINKLKNYNKMTPKQQYKIKDMNDLGEKNKKIIVIYCIVTHY